MTSHRKALLSKAAALVAPLIASVIALRQRQAIAETIHRIAYLAVSEAILESTSTPGETQ